MFCWVFQPANCFFVLRLLSSSVLPPDSGEIVFCLPDSNLAMNAVYARFSSDSLSRHVYASVNTFSDFFFSKVVKKISLKKPQHRE